MKTLKEIKKFDIQVLESFEPLNDTSLAQIKGGNECACDNGKKESICTCNSSSSYVMPCFCNGGNFTSVCTCNAGTLTTKPVEPSKPALIGFIQFE